MGTADARNGRFRAGRAPKTFCFRLLQASEIGKRGEAPREPDKKSPRQKPGACFVRAEAEGEAYVREAAEQMVCREIFTEEEIRSVDLSQLASFFRSPLGKRCAKSFGKGRLQRERAFDLQLELDGSLVIVQGIIDCFFEEEDGIVLLDYKTNRIDRRKSFAEEEERLRNQYQEQMDIYRKALSAALGKPVKEAWLYLFEPGRLIKM